MFLWKTETIGLPLSFLTHLFAGLITTQGLHRLSIALKVGGHLLKANAVFGIAALTAVALCDVSWIVQIARIVLLFFIFAQKVKVYDWKSRLKI